MAVRLSDVISKYEDAEKSGDIAEWLDKLELVAKLQDITKLESFVPLFLSGPAFAVYQQLNESDKSDYPKLKFQLVQAFGQDCFVAYEMLQRRVLGENETVDVYVANIKRLVNLMGQSVPEPLIKCAFVTGLPMDVATQLKALMAVESMALPEVICRARMILSTRKQTAGPCAVGRPSTPRTIQCYTCGASGHMARQCPKRRNIVCYGCGETGHIKKNCGQWIKFGKQTEGQGNDSMRASLPLDVPHL